MLKFLPLFIACFLSSPAMMQGLNLLSRPYEILAGPEVYHIRRRVTEGGDQQGLLGGGRLRIERIHPRSLYLGLEGYGAAGQLLGNDTTLSPMNSWLSEGQAEGRAGYTANTSYCPRLLLTPYLGYGSFYSTNKFSKDYPIPITFKNQFQFISAGVRTRFRIEEGLSAGFDFKVKTTFEGVRRITGDPDKDDVSIRMGDELQYSFDFPLQFAFCFEGWTLLANVTPFYRIRCYGYEAQEPFDFYETQFHIVGCRFMAGFEF